MIETNLSQELTAIGLICQQYLQNNYDQYELPNFAHLLVKIKGQAEGRLTNLCQRLALTTFERQVLVLCLAAEISVEFGELLSALSKGSYNRYPTSELTLTLLKGSLQALLPDASLRYWRLIEIQTGQGLLQATIRMPERVSYYLLGFDTLGHNLPNWLQPVVIPSSQLPILKQTVEAIIQQQPHALDTLKQKDLRLQLITTEPLHVQEVAVLLSAHFGTKPYQFRLADILASSEDIKNLQFWLKRECLFGQILLLIDCRIIHNPHIAAQQRQQLVHFISDLIEGVGNFLLWSEYPLAELDQEMQLIKFAKLNRIEQLTLWQQQLNNMVSVTTLGDLVEQFCMSRTQIENIAQQWQSLKSEINPEQRLWQLCRQQLRRTYSNKIRLVETNATWQDLILPPQELNLLKQLTDYTRYRYTLYHEWGFAKKNSRGLGIVTLFEGSSGTGKTMAAEVIACELQLDLLVIDLSRLLSKYVGETERNLEEVFTAAETSGAILLFDEADALFARRNTELRNSNDRYANQEVSYLLQRVESYSGLSILTSNLAAAFDPAFLRRFRTIVHFRFPDAHLRSEIWQRVLPKQLPVTDLDFTKLGEYHLSGGEIRMVALNAACKAAKANEPLHMEYLIEAILEEFAKQNRPIWSTMAKN